MTDTIDLLETIGRNASLRHAAPDDLARALRQAQGSAALVAAAASGDRSLLAGEFGQPCNQTPQVSQMPAPEEEQPADDEPLDIPAPAQS